MIFLANEELPPVLPEPILPPAAISVFSCTNPPTSKCENAEFPSHLDRLRNEGIPQGENGSVHVRSQAPGVPPNRIVGVTTDYLPPILLRPKTPGDWKVSTSDIGSPSGIAVANSSSGLQERQGFACRPAL